MLLINAVIKASPIHGYGCFAAEFIPKDAMVWAFDPRIDVRIRYDDVLSLPEPARAFLEMYGYADMYDAEKVVILCGDHAKHMNHSDEPNVLCIQGDMVRNVAARDIQPGEELTCNYYEFDLEAATKLGHASA